MVKKSLEKVVNKVPILSEEKVFKEYMAYINGDLPDELGTRGTRIIDQATTLARVLGYSGVGEWVNYLKQGLSKITPIEQIEQIRADYFKIKKLGRSERDINQAISIIESHGDIYGVKNDGSLFLESYDKKGDVVSKMKEYCRLVLNPKKETSQ